MHINGIFSGEGKIHVDGLEITRKTWPKYAPGLVSFSRIRMTSYSQLLSLMMWHSGRVIRDYPLKKSIPG
jgi:hypothetical protein